MSSDNTLLEPPSKKRKNNSSPIYQQTIFCKDVLINILSFSKFKFILQSAMLVSKEWKEASANVRLSLDLPGCECIIAEEEDKDEDEEEDTETYNLKIVCQCPNIANTTCLNMENCEMDESSTKWLAKSKYLYNLEELYLNHCTIGSEGIANMVSDGSCLKKLKTLALEYSDIGETGVKMLANSPIMSNLTFLDLYNNAIGNTGLEHIAKSKYLKQLTHLDLENNEIDEEGIALIGSSENFRELKFLSVAYNSFGENGLELLKNSPLPKLETLRLHSCGLTFEECQTIIDWPLLSQLKKLFISNNDVDEKQEQELKSLLSKKYPKLALSDSYSD